MEELNREMEAQAKTEARAKDAVPASTMHGGEDRLSRVRAEYDFCKPVIAHHLQDKDWWDNPH